MLHELLHPRLREKDALFFLILLWDDEPLLLGLFDRVLHKFLSKRAQDTEEEISLWKPSGELLLRRQIL